MKKLKQIKIKNLSEEDYKIFVEALNNPLEPNEALKRAYENYKDYITKNKNNYGK